ncbi:MAG TPA: AEC family transporter [Oligoflexus sp.]|uniref:AEC family transporter n=1 Tax=Oligoflexus sp. TaxID=1971216 RepID=UPI002D514AE6|nr:AEC family transporter [Oligoflexus sp.]HYX36435.1 AEC family transporter [Oligoflexus sp.]
MPLPTVIALLALGLGFGLESKGILPARIKAWIAMALINIFYPSLILAALLLRLNSASLASLWVLPFLMALTLVFGLGVGISLERRVGLQEDSQRRSFRFLCLLPNYSYLPLMVAQALWGDDGITLVAIAGVGADLVLWTVGVPQIMQQRHMDLRRLFLNPPLIALVLALILLQAPFDSWREMVQPGLRVLRHMGSATIPVSMLLLGAHLARRTSHRQPRTAHAVLLGLRLVLIPACLSLAFAIWPNLLPTLPRQVLILIASMPGAIVAVVLSEVHDASPDFAARHILLGHALWVLTGPLWLWINQV